MSQEPFLKYVFDQHSSDFLNNIRDQPGHASSNESRNRISSDHGQVSIRSALNSSSRKGQQDGNSKVNRNGVRSTSIPRSCSRESDIRVNENDMYSTSISVSKSHFQEIDVFNRRVDENGVLSTSISSSPSGTGETDNLIIGLNKIGVHSTSVSVPKSHFRENDDFISRVNENGVASTSISSSRDQEGDEFYSRRGKNDLDDRAGSGGKRNRAESCCGSTNENDGEDGGRRNLGGGAWGAQDNEQEGEVRSNKRMRSNRLCRNCGKEESCVLILPCRHLCLCTVCLPTIHCCPICKIFINASVVVNLS